tara:strand:- start:23477 stop:24859 length:1383 start_codon:yes stop_codon:yes gene_type:complete
MSIQDKIEHEIIANLLVSDLDLNDDLTNTITEQMFINSSLSEVFKAIIKVRNSGVVVDLMTVISELKRVSRLDYVGGFVFISSLTAYYIPSDQYRDRVLMLHEFHFRKRVVAISAEMQSMALNDTIDVFNVISRSVTLIDELNSNIDIRKEKAKKDIIEETITDIENRKQTGISGVPSGIFEVDSQVGGFERGGVTIIAGRPGSGKTAFALSMVNKMVCENGLNGLFFSLEMSAKSLFQRFFAINGMVKSSNIWRGQLDGSDWSKIGLSADKLNDAGIEVYDKYFTVSEIIAKCRSSHLKKPLDFVVIDYLQLMNSDVKTKGNREQEVSGISRALKVLSMQLNIPVIALSQLSRAVEQRGGDKRPVLSDLRESGSIEQDASTVLFTYRPSYYGFVGESGESLEDKAYLIMGKHRNGALKDIELHYRHDLNQEWCSQRKVSVESFVADEFQQSAIKPNEQF